MWEASPAPDWWPSTRQATRIQSFPPSLCLLRRVLVPRFLKLDDVAEELATSRTQVYALIRSRDLPAIRRRRPGQWRVERARFETWLRDRHGRTAMEMAEGRSDEDLGRLAAE